MSNIFSTISNGAFIIGLLSLGAAFFLSLFDKFDDSKKNDNRYKAWSVIMIAIGAVCNFLLFYLDDKAKSKMSNDIDSITKDNKQLIEINKGAAASVDSMSNIVYEIDSLMLAVYKVVLRRDREGHVHIVKDEASKLITVETLSDDGATIYDPFFSLAIKEISFGAQSYIIGSDFSQNTQLSTITLNGGRLVKGVTILARR